MRHWKPRLVGVLALGAAVAASVAVFQDLPAEMAVHWDASGQVDDTDPKIVGAFVVPAIAAATAAAMIVLPRLDPRRDHVEAVRGTYEWFVAATVVFLGYTHGLVLAANLGVDFSIGRALAPALAGIYAAVAALLWRAESNWIAGIRTPWTLESEAVWRRTQRHGAGAFLVAALLAAGAVVRPDRFLALTVLPVVLASAYLVAYSLWASRRERAGAGE